MLCRQWAYTTSRPLAEPSFASICSRRRSLLRPYCTATFRKRFLTFDLMRFCLRDHAELCERFETCLLWTRSMRITIYNHRLSVKYSLFRCNQL